MAHGSVIKNDSFKVPELTQLISNERSGNVSYTGTTRFTNGRHIRFDEDLWKTVMEPKREDLYLFKDDGIRRKPPFYYNTSFGIYTPTTYGYGKTFSVACQKLYREDDIINTAKKHLASYQKPKSVKFIDELPKAPTGKILKRNLRDPYWEDSEKEI